MGTFKREVEYKRASHASLKLESWFEKNGAERTMTCGSLRRELPIVGDIDLVILGSVVEFRPKLLKMKWFRIIEPSQGVRTLLGIVEKDIQVNIYFVKPEAWGAMVLFLTGSKFFNILIRSYAKKQGLKLNQYGLWHGEVLIAGKEEKQIFDALGLKWVDPPDREMRKEEHGHGKYRAPHVLVPV